MAETVKQRVGRRFKTTLRKTEREGFAGGGIGEHPLTIWLITTAVIVFLYIRRSRLGVDLHPDEKKQASIKFGSPSKAVLLRIPRSLPVLPPSEVDMSGGAK
jgi:hypothetical protein